MTIYAQILGGRRYAAPRWQKGLSCAWLQGLGFMLFVRWGFQKKEGLA